MASDDQIHSIEDVDPVDLTSIDPTADRLRFGARVEGVMDAAAGELARRRATPRGLAAIASQWGRVAWPAAAAVAIASVAVLRAEAPAIGATLEPVTIEEEMALAVGVPEALALWVESNESPVIGEILVGWEEQDR